MWPKGVGALDRDLATAIEAALSCNRMGAAVYGASFSWDAAIEQFVRALGGVMARRELQAA